MKKNICLHLYNQKLNDEEGKQKISLLKLNEVVPSNVLGNSNKLPGQSESQASKQILPGFSAFNELLEGDAANNIKVKVTKSINII